MVDTPGEKRLRMFWNHQYSACHAIVFMIDVSDVERYPEVKVVILAFYYRGS